MNSTLIIAEAGVNHNGNLELAKKLIEVASNAGADYVKFQSFKAGSIATKQAAQAIYQQKNAASDSQLAMLRKLELSEEDHITLLKYCTEKKIQFLSTPFDSESIELLKRLGIQLGKIPSGEITNLPYLRKMAQTFPQLILSTGMASLQEVKDALEVLLKGGAKKENIIVLHCTTEYPTPMEEVNLLAMPALGKELGLSYGYSDHTAGIEIPVAAVAMGAVVIEKHFTLDRNMEGPDHKASLEPGELKAMVRSIRNIEKAFGIAIKQPTVSEVKNKTVARKSIVAALPITKGELFTENNLTVKRPGSGINPMKWDEVIGKKSPRNFQADELIEL